MYVVRNKDTGLFIKSRSGSWRHNCWLASYYEKQGKEWSLWTDDLNEAKVYKSKGGIKNSIGVYKILPDGSIDYKLVRKYRRTVHQEIYELPDWAEIIEINIGFSIKE